MGTFTRQPGYSGAPRAHRRRFSQVPSWVLYTHSAGSPREYKGICSVLCPLLVWGRTGERTLQAQTKRETNSFKGLGYLYSLSVVQGSQKIVMVDLWDYLDHARGPLGLCPAMLKRPDGFRLCMQAWAFTPWLSEAAFLNTSSALLRKVRGGQFDILQSW